MNEAIENIARMIHELFYEWLRTDGVGESWPKQTWYQPFEEMEEAKKKAYRFVARRILQHLPILEISRL